MPDPLSTPTTPFVDFPYVRTFPQPVDTAYAWLTDYQDDDHTLAGAIIKRRDVIKREGNVVVLDGELETLGRRGKGIAEVHLFPEERRWIARLAGGRSVYDYRLTPAEGGGARLEVHYRIGARKWTQRLLLRLARRKALAEIDRMWEGFAQAMAKELAAVPAR